MHSMELLTDIIGKVLYLHDLEDIAVMADSEIEMETPVRFILASLYGQVILDEKYWFDAGSSIFTVDLKDVLDVYFTQALPGIGSEIFSTGSSMELTIDIGDGSITGAFTVNGMSMKSKERTSDIDILRIPEDYILPLSIHDFASRSGVEFVSPHGTVKMPEWLATTGTGKGSRERLVDMSGASMRLKKSFHVVFTGTEPEIRTPQFRFCKGHFEQYLFANRYGGFDNIPMDGQLLSEPETEHEYGIYPGAIRQIRSKCTEIFTQYSGPVSRKTVSAMKDLICSRQIYHYTDGSFRQIVVLESDISSGSSDTVHGFSFSYRYIQ